VCVEDPWFYCSFLLNLQPVFSMYGKFLSLAPDNDLPPHYRLGRGVLDGGWDPKPGFPNVHCISHVFLVLKCIQLPNVHGQSNLQFILDFPAKIPSKSLIFHNFPWLISTPQHQFPPRIARTAWWRRSRARCRSAWRPRRRRSWRCLGGIWTYRTI